MVEIFNFSTDAIEWKQPPLHHHRNNRSMIKPGVAADTYIIHVRFTIVKQKYIIIFFGSPLEKIALYQAQEQICMPGQKKKKNC
jgi:hypothetical protein